MSILYVWDGLSAVVTTRCYLHVLWPFLTACVVVGVEFLATATFSRTLSCWLDVFSITAFIAFVLYWPTGGLWHIGRILRVHHIARAGATFPGQEPANLALVPGPGPGALPRPNARPWAKCSQSLIGTVKGDRITVSRLLPKLSISIATNGKQQQRRIAVINTQRVLHKSRLLTVNWKFECTCQYFCFSKRLSCVHWHCLATLPTGLEC